MERAAGKMASCPRRRGAAGTGVARGTLRRLGAGGSGQSDRLADRDAAVVADLDAAPGRPRRRLNSRQRRCHQERPLRDRFSCRRHSHPGDPPRSPPRPEPPGLWPGDVLVRGSEGRFFPLGARDHGGRSAGAGGRGDRFLQRHRSLLWCQEHRIAGPRRRHVERLEYQWRSGAASCGGVHLRRAGAPGDAADLADEVRAPLRLPARLLPALGHGGQWRRGPRAHGP